VEERDLPELAGEPVMANAIVMSKPGRPRLHEAVM